MQSRGSRNNGNVRNAKGQIVLHADTGLPVGMPAFHAGRQCQNGNTSVGVTRGSACVYRPDAGGGNDLVPDEKRRETLYKEVVRKCDPAEWIRIIKTLFLRKKARIQAGKKVTSGDEKYLRIAEENLYGEFAMALDMTKEETEKYVIERVKSAEEKGAVTASE